MSELGSLQAAARRVVDAAVYPSSLCCAAGVVDGVSTAVCATAAFAGWLYAGGDNASRKQGEML